MAQDPTVTDPGLYRVFFENERVRVLEYRDRPGDRTHHSILVQRKEPAPGGSPAPDRTLGPSTGGDDAIA